jgi:hypothetical protein
MKINRPDPVRNCIAAIVIGLAVTYAGVTAQDPPERSIDSSQGCPTVRPGPDWTCAHGGWWPPGMAIPGLPSTPPPAPPDPQGVWRVTTTPRNCVTGVPIPTAAFQALFTFHKDGTMSAWLQNSPITTTRSPNHGLWMRENGSTDYSFKFVHLRYSLTTGEFIGRQEGGGTLVLGESGDEFTTDGSSALFDANSNPTSTGCSNSVGTRFKLEQ